MLIQHLSLWYLDRLWLTQEGFAWEIGLSNETVYLKVKCEANHCLIWEIKILCLKMSNIGSLIFLCNERVLSFVTLWFYGVVLGFHFNGYFPVAVVHTDFTMSPASKLHSLYTDCRELALSTKILCSIIQKRFPLTSQNVLIRFYSVLATAPGLIPGLAPGFRFVWDL